MQKGENIQIPSFKLLLLLVVHIVALVRAVGAVEPDWRDYSRDGLGSIVDDGGWVLVVDGKAIMLANIPSFQGGVDSGKVVDEIADAVSALGNLFVGSETTKEGVKGFDPVDQVVWVALGIDPLFFWREGLKLLGLDECHHEEKNNH